MIKKLNKNKSANKEVKPKTLTPKQELFIKEYLIDLNSTRAYKEVYKSSDKTANTNWPKLLVNTGIQKKIQEKFNERAEKIDLNSEWVLRNLKETYEEARENKNYSASIRWLELIGKHLWMFTEKIDVNAKSEYTLIDAFEDLAKKRKEREKKERQEQEEEARIKNK